MQMELQGEDDDGYEFETTHVIAFDDGETKWFDLAEEEVMGRLKWENEDDEDRKPPAVPKTEPVPDSAPSSTRVRFPKPTQVPDSPPSSSRSRFSKPAPAARLPSVPSPDAAKRRIVTPEKRQCKKPRTEKRPVDNITSDEISLKDLEYWLTNIHRGSRGNPLSKANINSVMRQVRKLVNGYGIKYESTWPEGTIFKHGIHISLAHDLAGMHQEAKDFEEEHGRDKGHGWLLQHPIKKLQLYKEEYAIPVRTKKRQFLCFLGTTLRPESPSAVVSGVEDVLKTIFAFSVRNKE